MLQSDSKDDFGMKPELELYELESVAREIQYAIEMMKPMIGRHSSAKITYNFDKKRVSVAYPLPKDSLRIEAFVKENILNQDGY